MNFDYDSIRTRLITNLRKRASWANILPNSVNMRIIEPFAEEEQELARYDEYLTRESKWDLARNVSSLFYTASLLSYRPHRNIGATGVLEVSSNESAFATAWNTYTTYDTGDIIRHEGTVYESTIDTNLSSEPTVINTDWSRVRTNHTRNIGISKYTIFSSTTGLSYVSTEAITLLASVDYVEVPIVQGELKTTSFVAVGDTFEEVFIDSTSIDNTYYEVYVNGTKWTEYQYLKEAGATDKGFQTFDTADFSRVYFRFGDDITGKKLSPGDAVQIYYVETSGATGNVSVQGQITTVDSSLVDTQGNTVDMFCYNYDAITGGKSTEDLESIRTNGILSFQAGDRLVSSNDYTQFLETNFDFIEKAVVWGAYEQNLDDDEDPWEWITPTENLIYIAAITPGSAPLDILLNADGSENSTNKVTIMTTIRDKKSPTDIVSFQNVEFIYLTVASTVYVENSNYLLSEMVETVKQTIIDNYGIDKIDFRQEIYESNYQRLIDSVEGVRYHSTEFSFYQKTSFESASFDASGVLPLFEIEANSVRVVAESSDGLSTFTVGTDDGSGGFTPSSGDYVFSGGSSIVYATGAYNFELTTATPLVDNFSTYTVKIYYDSVSNDLLPKERYQILTLDEDEISISTTYYDGI